MFMYVSIGQAAEIVGVSISTLRRWEYDEYFIPDYRTKGGHRRYNLDKINSQILNSPSQSSHKDSRINVSYARVSSHDQKLDLKRQEKRLEKYCGDKGWDTTIISDLGSGINYKKRGLNKLIEMICKGKVARLIITHKDRLLRFGSPLLFKICEYYNTEVVIIEHKNNLSFDEELVSDVLEIMTVFTAKRHGKRSHSNRRACAIG